MNPADKLIAEKLRLLSASGASVCGVYLLGFMEALRLSAFAVDAEVVKNACDTATRTFVAPAAK